MTESVSPVPAKNNGRRYLVGGLILSILTAGFVAVFLLLRQNQDLRQQALVKPTTKATCEQAGCLGDGTQYEWRWEGTENEGECKKYYNKDCQGVTGNSGGENNNGNGTYYKDFPGVGSVLMCGSAAITGCNSNVCMDSNTIVQSCALQGGGSCFKETGTCSNNCLDGECKLPPPPKEGEIQCHEITEEAILALGGVINDQINDAADTCNSCTTTSEDGDTQYYYWNEEFKSCKLDLEETGSCGAAGWSDVGGGLCCPTSGPDKCSNPGSFTCITDPYVSQCVPTSQSHIPGCAAYVDYVWKPIQYYATNEELLDDERCAPGSSPSPSPSPSSTPPGPQCVSLSISNPTPQVGDVVTFTCGEVAGADHYVFRIKNPLDVVWDLDATGNVSQEITIGYEGTYHAQCQICTGADASTCFDYEAWPTE